MGSTTIKASSFYGNATNTRQQPTTITNTVNAAATSMLSSMPSTSIHDEMLPSLDITQSSFQSTNFNHSRQQTPSDNQFQGTLQLPGRPLVNHVIENRLSPSLAINSNNTESAIKGELILDSNHIDRWAEPMSETALTNTLQNFQSMKMVI